MTPARRAVVATAPSRIDLAGGTLDIWPISALVPGALTVNLAIDLPATVEVAPRSDRSLRVVSHDRGKGATRRLPLSPGDVRGGLSLLLRLAAHADLGRGATLLARAEAPAGAGLGGSSTLAVAAAAALARFSGERLSREALLRRVMNLEAAEIGVPTGNQDYLAALHGGLAAYHHEPDGVRREALPGAREVAARLVLAYTGRPRASGFSNWEMFRRFVEGDRDAVRAMRSIARIARETADALRAGDLDACGRRLGAEGRLRDTLAPSVSTPELARCAAAARDAGAIGTKVCGAGGGGCIVAFAGIGRSADVARAFEACGARVLPVRAARRGVRVEALAEARTAGRAVSAPAAGS